MFSYLRVSRPVQGRGDIKFDHTISDIISMRLYLEFEFLLQKGVNAKNFSMHHSFVMDETRRGAIRISALFGGASNVLSDKMKTLKKTCVKLDLLELSFDISN